MIPQTKLMSGVQAVTDPVTGVMVGINDPVANAVLPVGAPKFASRNLTIALVGDSITGGASNAYPRSDWVSGLGVYDNLATTNINTGAVFLRKCYPDGACVATNSIVVTWDGVNSVTAAVDGDTTGVPVDVTGGGFFHVVSGTNGKGISIQVVWANAPVGVKTDTITVTGTRTIIRDTFSSIWMPALARQGYGNATVRNFGITGDTPLDLLARIAQVTAEYPDVAMLHIGTNSILQTAQIASIIDYLCARVPVVVVMPVLPRGDLGTAALAQKQAACARFTDNYARTKRTCIVYDAWSVLGSPAGLTGTGCINTDYFAADYVHPNSYGCITVGADLYSKVIAGLFSNVRGMESNGCDLWDATYNPYGNTLGTGGIFTGTAGTVGANPVPTGSLATGWTDAKLGGGDFGSVVYSQPARDDGRNGLWQRVVMTTAGATGSSRSLVYTPPAGLVAGGWARARITIRLKDYALVNLLNVYYKAAGSSVDNFAYLLYLGQAQVGGSPTDSGVMYFQSAPFLVPAGVATTSKLIVQIGCAVGGSVTVDLADAVVEMIPA